MLVGSLGGGVIAQHTSVGVPFVLRAAILAVMFLFASVVMHDIGFTPDPRGRPLTEMRHIVATSVDLGWRVPAVKWLMVDSLFTGGVAIYAFYALQPYLLELYGDPHAYQIAGLAAAIVAGAQILGGLLAPQLRHLVHRRTSALLAISALGTLALALMGLLQSFWLVISLVSVWGLLYAAAMPIRQTYLNGLIPSKQRATILSFDSLMGSSGGVWGQPVLGKSADVWGYGPSYVIGAAISALALPALALSRRQDSPADRVTSSPASPGEGPTAPREGTSAPG
jgi:MFS family permease